MFTKILIANRGEIACRIIRTARRMKIRTVAIYSEIDLDSLHVSLADEAYCVGPAKALDSYLNIKAILDVATKHQVEAIHPGYGFLSENVAFARACQDANVCLIGPSVATMEIMGSKQLAKQRLEKTTVPLTPGYHGKNQSDDHLLKAAQKIGFPLLLKAACGGGGKGMRTVYQEADFKQALISARREAKASFADETMLIEKLIAYPRHVEIQIMADHHGQVVHLFERDCSIQRRHQKIIEEAPADYLTTKQRKQLADAAIEVARIIDYRGAGTIEFLVAPDQSFYFMEMNTRLQVEHPVTEMITGLDLVEWQIKIAAHEPLPLTQQQIEVRGHAIECRIYAEDPEQDCLPSIGQIHFLQEPTGEHVRLETGIIQYSSISQYYDPMIAKLIAWGETREAARLRLITALQQYHIGGVKTNLSFLQAILEQEQFMANDINTHFLTQHAITTPIPDKWLAARFAAAIDYMSLVPKAVIPAHAEIHASLDTTVADPLYHDTFAWQMHLKSQWVTTYLIASERLDVLVVPVNHQDVKLTIHHPEHREGSPECQEMSCGARHDLQLESTQPTTTHWQLAISEHELTVHDGQTIQRVCFERLSDKIILYFSQGPVEVQPFNWENGPLQQTDHQLTAPMPGTVIAVFKKAGESIQKGDPLMILEAMKMEHTIRSPSDGTIQTIYYEVGAQVNEGVTLVDLEQP